jgi:hypothetical protein
MLMTTSLVILQRLTFRHHYTSTDWVLKIVNIWVLLLAVNHLLLDLKALDTIIKINSMFTHMDILSKVNKDSMGPTFPPLHLNDSQALPWESPDLL